jgi:hypothetical protein
MSTKKSRRPKPDRQTATSARQDSRSKAITKRLVAVVRELRALDRSIASIRGLTVAARARRVLATAAKQLAAVAEAMKVASATRAAPARRRRRTTSAPAPERKPAGERVVIVDRVDEADDDEEEEEEEEEIDVVAPATSWRVYVLRRVTNAGAVSIEAMQVCERVDDANDREDPDFRVWLLGLMEDSPWWMHPAYLEAGNIRMEFPADEYAGLPPYLDLERPRVARIGSPWRLMAPNRGAVATFECTVVADEDHLRLRRREALLQGKT